jgi:hypothetical protein
VLFLKLKVRNGTQAQVMVAVKTRAGEKRSGEKGQGKEKRTGEKKHGDWMG